MKFVTCTFLAVAALAALGAAAPTGKKEKEEIKELCRSDRLVQFHSTGEHEWEEPDLLVYAADLCDDKKEHLKHGIHYWKGHVEGDIKHTEGARVRVWGDHGTE
ncbi:hypothetical protein LTR56_023362 [Elasticomyces elasticus]|nr:hypothetical protein LTR56_023362 [Elasticomyces elasticus]KAK3652572.1 hypothetical protein LTR22_011522 [Elasticomyces elasticus]KAK4914933.1 hypothetical protein LTR49_016922 [Elasticomyces elasticus]KAK5740616.1 hypothetical protein LTS12_024875 [Elasticomyces elasticus]